MYAVIKELHLNAPGEGISIRRLVAAVREGDLDTARSMLEMRPELVNVCVAEDDEHRALHHAVIERHAEMVRLLMQHGADSRAGIWPHRDATCAGVMARERGYAEIVAIIEQEEARRGAELARAVRSPDIRRAFQAGDQTAMIAALDAHPGLIHASDERGRTALHWAASQLWPQLAVWLLDHGADVGARTRAGDTAMDLLGEGTDAADSDQPRLIETLAEMLLRGGSARTARWAIVANDADGLRARHAEGVLSDQRGLLTHAIRSDRLEMLQLLLGLGLDPDDAGTLDGLDEAVVTFGEPLRACALTGQLVMAECLLQHGANANTNVYAATSALLIAHERHDAAMIALLERHGARLDPVSVGALGLTDRAAALLKDAASAAEGLLWAAIERPSPEIVRMALEHIDWPRGDARWHGILQNGVYPSAESHRIAHLEGLRVVLDRADVNIRSKRGATLLHYIAAAHGDRTADDRRAYASMLLDADARLDVRDDLLNSTPLGWACRWGRAELVTLFLERGADPNEPEAEPWARPAAWAEKMHHSDVLDIVSRHPRYRP